MPNEFIPLTEEEKQTLIAKHLQYIGEINRYLPDGQKLVYNQQEFLARLDNPVEVDQYRKGIARMERLQKLEEIKQQMADKYGAPPRGRNYLNRTFFYSFKTEDTPEAKEYNKKIYLEYCENPEKVLYTRLNNVLNFNPKPFVDNLGNPPALIDFYDANQVLVEDAFAFSSIVENGALEWVTPQFRNALACLKKPIESLNEAQKLAFAAAGTSEYLTMPKLTAEQARHIINSNPAYMTDANAALRNGLLNALGTSDEVEQTVDFYNKLRQNGLNVDADFFVSHVAEHRDPETGAVTEVSFDEALNHRPNVTIRRRTQDEIWHIRNISKEYEREYLHRWQANYTAKNQEQFDLAVFEDRHKGGVFERMFGTTSREYRSFTQALRDFNDPTSKDFLNRQKLRSAGEAYRQHKLGNGRTIDQLDATGKGRVEHVDNILANLDDMEQKEAQVRQTVESVVYGNLPPRVGKPFLQRSDVEPKSQKEIDKLDTGIAVEAQVSKEQDPIDKPPVI